MSSVPSALASRNPLPEITCLLFLSRPGALDDMNYRYGREGVLFQSAWVQIAGREISVHTRRSYPNVAILGVGWLAQFRWREYPTLAIPETFEGDIDLCISDLDALKTTLDERGLIEH